MCDYERALYDSLYLERLSFKNNINCLKFSVNETCEYFELIEYFFRTFPGLENKFFLNANDHTNPVHIIRA